MRGSGADVAAQDSKKKRVTLNQQLYELEDGEKQASNSDSDFDEGNDDLGLGAMDNANDADADEESSAAAAAVKPSKKKAGAKAGRRETIEQRLERLNRMARGDAASGDEFSDASSDSDDDDDEDAEAQDGEELTLTA